MHKFYVSPAHTAAHAVSGGIELVVKSDNKKDSAFVSDIDIEMAKQVFYSERILTWVTQFKGLVEDNPYEFIEAREVPNRDRGCFYVYQVDPDPYADSYWRFIGSDDSPFHKTLVEKDGILVSHADWQQWRDTYLQHLRSLDSPDSAYELALYESYSAHDWQDEMTTIELQPDELVLVTYPVDTLF